MTETLTVLIRVTMDDPFFVWHVELSTDSSSLTPSTRRVTVISRTLDNAVRLVREAYSGDVVAVEKYDAVDFMELP